MWIQTQQQISYASIMAELSKQPRGVRFWAHQPPSTSKNPTSLHRDPHLAVVLEHSRNQKCIWHLLRLSYSLSVLPAFLNSKNTPSMHQKMQSSHHLGYPTCTATTRTRPAEPAGRDTHTYIKRFQIENRKTDQIWQRLKATGHKLSLQTQLRES